jgi:hypothetical protein
LSEFPNIIRDKEGKIVKSKVYGLDIYVGSCLKVVYGRFCWYIRVVEFSENPTRVIGEDIYGNTVVINLAKATLVMTINEEEYYAKKFAVEQRLKKKEEEALKSKEEAKEEETPKETKKKSKKKKKEQKEEVTQPQKEGDVK